MKDHTELRNRLNAKAKHEEENRRIEIMESDLGPWFWIAVGMLTFYVMWMPK